MGATRILRSELGPQETSRGRNKDLETKGISKRESAFEDERCLLDKKTSKSKALLRRETSLKGEGTSKGESGPRGVIRRGGNHDLENKRGLREENQDLEDRDT